MADLDDFTADELRAELKRRERDEGYEDWEIERREQLKRMTPEVGYYEDGEWHDLEPLVPTWMYEY